MDGWLFFAWMVPVAWGLAALIDVLMIEWDIYQSPVQATAISGLVVAVPLLVAVTPFAALEQLDMTSVAVGICSGICYALHLHYFYKAVFIANDAAHTEAFMNIEVVVVPVLAFLFLGESLGGSSYLSIVLAAFGVIVLNWETQRIVASQRYLIQLLTIAVMISSIAFILQDILFDLTSYRTALVCYSIGVLAGITPLLLQQGIRRTCGRLLQYAVPVFFAEVFAVIATLSSMRAIASSPPVSLVAVIETFRPLVIMTICFLMWIAMRHAGLGYERTLAALRMQFSGSFRKLFACTLLSCGVFLASVQ